MSRAWSALRRIGSFLWEMILRFGQNRGSVHSGNIAYALMLAVVPFLIFATALTGFFVGQQGAEMPSNGCSRACRNTWR